MECSVCGLEKMGEDLYDHERRVHGLSLGQRLVNGAWQQQVANLQRQVQQNLAPRAAGHERGELPSEQDTQEIPGGEHPEGDEDEEYDEEYEDDDDDDDDGQAGRGGDGGERCSEMRADPVTRRAIKAGLKKEYEDFVASLEVERGIPASIVDEIAEKFQEFSSYGANADPCGQPLTEVAAESRVTSAKRRLQMYKGKLGELQGSLKWMPGTFSSRPNIYFKPISLHLKELLSVDRVVESVTGRQRGQYTPWHEDVPGMVFDFRSSTRFKKISSHLGTEEFVAVRVFGDGFGLHRLGAHRLDSGNLYGIYAQIASYPSHLCRKVTSWVTVSLAQLTDETEEAQVWYDVVDDLEILQETGVWIPALDRVVSVVLIGYAGDLKDQSLVANMAPPGSSFYPHTNCTVTLRDRRECQSFDDINPLTRMRNREDHERDIRRFQRTGCMKQSRGAKGSSVFDPIADIFHEGFFTTDLGHSLHLGVLKSDLGLILSLYTAIADLSEEGVMGMLEAFKEKLTGEERPNFVTNILAPRTKRTKINFTGAISQMRLLGKYAPVIFARLKECETKNPHSAHIAWRGLVSLHRLFRFGESFALSQDQLVRFQEEIERYINLRIEIRDVYQTVTRQRVDLLPKHIDYALAASNFKSAGSLILSSTSVMESRHGLHKTAIEKGRNRINPLKSLAVKTELYEKYHLGSLLSDKEVVPARWGIPRRCPTISAQQRAHIAAGYGAHNVCLEIRVHGKTIKSGNACDLYEDEACRSTKTTKFLAAHIGEDEEVRLLVEEMTVNYLADFDVFSVASTQGNVKNYPLGALVGPFACALIESPALGCVFVKPMMVANILE